MALTQDSFRDPRKLWAVKVTSGFFIEGRKPAETGEILQVPRSRASELVHSGKAVYYTPPETPAAAPPPPAVAAAESAAPVHGKTSTSSKEKTT